MLQSASIDAANSHTDSAQTDPECGRFLSSAKTRCDFPELRRPSRTFFEECPLSGNGWLPSDSAGDTDDVDDRESFPGVLFGGVGFQLHELQQVALSVVRKATHALVAGQKYVLAQPTSGRIRGPAIHRGSMSNACL